jgi:CheY-like chemotaxis protein
MNNGNRKSQLLFIGNEPMLSKASAELLKRVGYRVRTTNPLNALNAVREGPYTAVILCATLSCEETEEIVRALATHPAPIVSIHLGLLGDGPHPASAVVVDALKGPEALISAVDAVAHLPSRPISNAV